MKTTIEIPDEIFRQTKAYAALRGETLRAVVSAALVAHLRRQGPASSKRGWRTVFGEARPSEVAEVDAVIDAEFEQVNLDDWR